MNRKQLILGIASIVILLLVAGCSGSNHRPTPMPPVTQIQDYPEPEDRYSNPGSLYSESSGMLFSDSRARRVGDIILVRIVENTKAKNKADTTADKTTSNNLSVKSIFGRTSVSPVLFGGFMKADVGASPLVDISNSSKLTGTGETKRENAVSTTIGARVVQVLPNNILQIEGIREIRVNEETEYMVISGLVRGSDVLSDNSILSTQLANSSIAYYGEGDIARKQKQGWFSRLLESVGAF